MVTIVVEGLRIPAVNVELRDADRNVVDRAHDQRHDRPGHVSRRASRPLYGKGGPGGLCRQRVDAVHGAGRRDTTGARRDAIDVRPRERRGRRPGQLADRKPAAGGGQRSADGREDGYPAARGRRFPVAPDRAPKHHPRSRGAAAHQGRRSHDRRAADEQREPERPVDRRFRSRAAERRGGIGRGAVESLRSGVRPVLHERHAGAHQARHRGVGLQAEQPDARIRQGVRVRQQVRATLLDLGTAQTRQPVARPVLPVPLRPHARSRACPTSLSSASTASTRSRGSTRHCRRVMRSPAGSSTSRAKSQTRRCRRFGLRRRRRSSRRRASRRAWSIG